jgi:hypothetical protein
MRTRWILLAAALLGLSGCQDETAPRDLFPPAAPRGLVSVTGDHKAYLSWYANTEDDVAGYRIYESDCAGGPQCDYLPIGTTTGTHFTVTGLTNGVTRYFAVAAYDLAGNESELSANDVFDTPRPEGSGVVLANVQKAPATSGWDFSATTVRAWDNSITDMYFSWNGTTALMAVPDLQTDIQDAGYASTLDAVDFAPTAGWSPTGTVELITGHCYIVWTRDDHYAKFRVTDLSLPNQGPASVTFDWAYQVAPTNRELRARPTGPGTAALRPVAW